jgi:hypothetical protein
MIANIINPSTTVAEAVRQLKTSSAVQVRGRAIADW